MKFIPILFKTPMVEAINGDIKNQTRRLLNPQPDLDLICKDTTPDMDILSYVNVKAHKGDVFWVRETFQSSLAWDSDGGYIYKASENGRDWEQYSEGWRWKPSIYMPKDACRIFLKITDVLVEPLQEISEDDAKSEGVQRCSESGLFKNYLSKSSDNFTFRTAKSSFKSLWESINGKSSWVQNPYVWVYKFKKIDEPETFNS